MQKIVHHIFFAVLLDAPNIVTFEFVFVKVLFCLTRYYGNVERKRSTFTLIFFSQNEEKKKQSKMNKRREMLNMMEMM